MAAPRYRADPPDQLRKVELDGLTALFHVPSGTTHILAAPAPQILDALARGPATAATIMARMKKKFTVQAGPGAGLALESRLRELEAAGLVARL